MKRIRVSAAAKADVDRAEAWYESQKKGLGDRFLKAVLEAGDRVAKLPEGYPKVVGEARRAALLKFPYALWFKLRKDDVLMIACLHTKRSPLFIQERSSGIIPIREPS